MSHYRFGKNKRLMYAAEFKHVFDCNKNSSSFVRKANQNPAQVTSAPANPDAPQGYRFANAYFSILAVETEHPTARLGIVVAKKNLKFATQRNRFKRLAREYFRLHLNLERLDYVVMARPHFVQIAHDGQRVMQEFENAFAYIARKYSKNSSQS